MHFVSRKAYWQLLHLLEGTAITLQNQLLSNRFATGIWVSVLINRKIGQAFIPIHDLFTSKDDIICAHVYKPLYPILDADFQDMAGSIYVHLINTSKLQHLLPRHAI